MKKKILQILIFIILVAADIALFIALVEIFRWPLIETAVLINLSIYTVIPICFPKRRFSVIVNIAIKNTI